MFEKLTKEQSFLELPEEIQEVILKYGKACIGINADIADKPLPLNTNKFGGIPFIPEGGDIPRDEKNRPYLMLVQLNFKEIFEEVGQHPELPTQGLLQIYIQGFVFNEKHVVKYYESFDKTKINKEVTDEYREFFFDACKLNREKINLDKQGVKYDERKEKLLATEFAKKYQGLPDFPLYDECVLQLKAEIAMPISDDIDIPLEELELVNKILGKTGKAYLNSSYHRLMGFISGYSQDDPRIEY